MKRDLVIVQPYVPKYRIGFFTKLIVALDASGIRCKIVAASPTGQQLTRGDSARIDGVLNYNPRQISMRGKTIGLGGARPFWKNADAVIVGHLGSSLDTYLAIADARLGRNRVGLWGHIKPYVNTGHPVDLALERWQLRNADHIFAYVPSGRDYSISAGVSPERVTAVMNATDTEVLVRARKSVTDEQLARFMHTYDLVPGKCVGFMGGLDDSKRIDFLAATLDKLWLADPEIRIVIGGLGAKAGVLEPAISRGQAVMLGYVDADTQALIGRAASALLMPGRIGLVAVDALVLGIPILTTDWPFHAPEAEYLVEGESRFTSRNNVESYSELVHSFVAKAPSSARSQADVYWPYPTVDAMVSNFARGVIQLLH